MLTQSDIKMLKGAYKIGICFQSYNICLNPLQKFNMHNQLQMLDSGVDSYSSSEDYQNANVQAPELMQEQFDEIVFYTDYSQTIRLIDVVSLVSDRQDTERLLAGVISLKSYIEQIQYSNSLQQQLLRQINIISIIQHTLTMKRHQLVFETFDLVYNLAKYVPSASPLYSSVVEENCLLVLSLIFKMLEFNNRRLNTRAFKLLAHLALEDGDKTFRFIFQRNLLVEISRVILQRKITSAYVQYANIIKLAMPQTIALFKFLNEEEIISIFRAVTILYPERKPKLKAIVKKIVKWLNWYLQKGRPEFMLNYIKQICEVLPAVKHFSSEFLQLFLWAIQNMGTNEIVTEQLMQRVLFYASNQQIRLSPQILQITLLCCKSFEWLQPACQSQIKQLVSNIISRSYHKNYSYLNHLYNICLQTLSNKSHILQQAQYPLALKKIEDIYKWQNSKNNSFQSIQHMVVVRDILKQSKQRLKSLLPEEKQSWIRTMFQGFEQKVAYKLRNICLAAQE